MAAATMKGDASGGSRVNLSGAATVEPKLPSAELVARVLQPEIVANIISYARHDNRELCRLLKVCQAFYHEATRLLYASIAVDVDDKQNYYFGGRPVNKVLVDLGNKKASLAHLHCFDIRAHKKSSCAAFVSGDSMSDATALLPTLPNLKTLHFGYDDDTYFQDGEDCDAEDCPLTRSLHPTVNLVFVMPLSEDVKDTTVDKLKAAITRLSTSATSVTLDFDRAGPIVLDKFIATPVGAGVTDLTFAFGFEGECGHSLEWQEVFARACKLLVASFKRHKMDKVTTVTFDITQIDAQCCWQCTESSAKTFGKEAARYKTIWERESRNLPRSLQKRVSVEWYQHSYPMDDSDFFDYDSEDGYDTDYLLHHAEWF